MNRRGGAAAAPLLRAWLWCTVLAARTHVSALGEQPEPPAGLFGGTGLSVMVAQTMEPPVTTPGKSTSGPPTDALPTARITPWASTTAQPPGSKTASASGKATKASSSSDDRKPDSRANATSSESSRASIDSAEKDKSAANPPPSKAAPPPPPTKPTPPPPPAKVGDNCTSSAQCKSGCCRGEDGTLIDVHGHDGLTATDLVAQLVGKCSNVLGGVGEYCGQGCPCGKDMKCQAPQTGVCCQPELCYLNTELNRVQQYLQRCQRRPGCRMPPSFDNT